MLNRFLIFIGTLFLMRKVVRNQEAEYPEALPGPVRVRSSYVLMGVFKFGQVLLG